MFVATNNFTPSDLFFIGWSWFNFRFLGINVIINQLILFGFNHFGLTRFSIFSLQFFFWVYPYKLLLNHQFLAMLRFLFLNTWLISWNLNLTLIVELIFSWFHTKPGYLYTCMQINNYGPFMTCYSCFISFISKYIKHNYGKVIIFFLC